MSRINVLPLFASASLLVSACGGPTKTPPVVNVDPKLSDIQTKIFTPTCATAACHDSGGANLSGKLDLTKGKAYAQLVGVAATYPDVALKRVEAGKPDQSFLITKIKDTTHLDLAKYGAPMPNGGVPLTDQQVQAISDWITAGAMDD